VTSVAMMVLYSILQRGKQHQELLPETYPTILRIYHQIDRISSESTRKN
jgi:hypothetical protein